MKNEEEREKDNYNENKTCLTSPGARYHFLFVYFSLKNVLSSAD